MSVDLGVWDALCGGQVRCYYHSMTKLELAVQEARKLSPEEQERLGDGLLHYIHKSLALQEALDSGLRQIEAGQVVDGHEIFARLKAKYGA